MVPFLLSLEKYTSSINVQFLIIYWRIKMV